MTTVITNPQAPEVQALFVRANLRLYAKGMTHSRMSKRYLMDRASNITGKTYKRGQIETAIADLTSIIDAAKQ